MPLTKQSGIACFNNSCSTPVENRCCNGMNHLVRPHLANIGSSGGDLGLSICVCVMFYWYCSKNHILNIIQFIIARRKECNGQNDQDDFGTQCDWYLLSSCLDSVFSLFWFFFCQLMYLFIVVQLHSSEYKLNQYTALVKWSYGAF